MTITETISQSAKDFQNIVWPILKKKIGGGRIIPVETVTDNVFAKEIDMLAGIDVWHIYENGMGMHGIASRVQWKYNDGRIAKGFGKYGYQTFTIRYQLPSGAKTEYHKRMHAIKADRDKYLFPDLTIQAYLEKPEGEFLSGAVIDTRELFEIIATRPDLLKQRAAYDGNIFLYIEWKDIRIAAAKSLIYLCNKPKEQLLFPDLKELEIF